MDGRESYDSLDTYISILNGTRDIINHYTTDNTGVS